MDYKIISTIDEYNAIINNEKHYTNIILNISASWCLPCKKIKQPIEEYITLSNLTEWTFIYIDECNIDLVDEISNNYNVIINKYPYFICCKLNENNKLVKYDEQHITKYDEFVRWFNTMTNDYVILEDF